MALSGALPGNQYARPGLSGLLSPGEPCGYSLQTPEGGRDGQLRGVER